MSARLRRYWLAVTLGLCGIGFAYVAVILWITRTDQFDLSSMDSTGRAPTSGGDGSLLGPIAITVLAVAMVAFCGLAWRRKSDEASRT